jgi:predicted choloylglycine hydrolase
MLANLSYDLILGRLGCSTIALATPSGPVVARNMDWWPEDLLAQASFLVRSSHQGKFCFANAAWPGAIGVVTGLSARGFAIVLNAVTCPEGLRKTGYPMLLHLRRVLEDAKDFDDALRMLTEQTLAAPGLLTLVGSKNEQRVVIERTPTRQAQRWPRGSEPLVTTNHYRLLFQPEHQDPAQMYDNTCSRYEAACSFLAKLGPDREVEDAALLYLLSDPAVIQGITAQHIILRPARGEVRLFVPSRLLSATAKSGDKPW